MQNIDIDNSKYNLLLNHEPDQLKAMIDKKIDLQVSGHTKITSLSAKKMR